MHIRPPVFKVALALAGIIHIALIIGNFIHYTCWILSWPALPAHVWMTCVALSKREKNITQIVISNQKFCPVEHCLHFPCNCHIIKEGWEKKNCVSVFLPTNPSAGFLTVTVLPPSRLRSPPVFFWTPCLLLLQAKQDTWSHGRIFYLKKCRFKYWICYTVMGGVVTHGNR